MSLASLCDVIAVVVHCQLALFRFLVFADVIHEERSQLDRPGSEDQVVTVQWV